MILDADADTSITADTDDTIDFRIGGFDIARMLTVGSTPTFSIASTEAGASSGPTFRTRRQSASPAASDLLGNFAFEGRSSTDVTRDYARITARIKDPTNTSEDAELEFRTLVAGSDANRLQIGNGVYTPNATGGDKGADSINASAVYDDNSLLTCYVPEAATTGKINIEALDDSVLNLEREDGTIEVRTHGPARAFLSRMARDLDIGLYAEDWKAKGHLPSMPSKDEWTAAGFKMSIGGLLQRLWETVEVQAVHIDKLNQRLTTSGL